ncbi:reverse transcriptase domain-containing protein [Tanacetum coccineum]
MVKDLLTNKEKLLEMENTPLNENCSAVLFKTLPKKFGDTGRFLIPCDFYGFESCMALSDLVDYDVDPRVPLILVRPFLRTAHALVDHGDESIHKIDILDVTCEDHFHEGDIRFIETLLNNDISNDLPPLLPVFMISETEKIKSSIDDPTDLKLKDLPPHLEYAFLEGTSKLHIIIAKDLKREEKEQLLKVLKSYKRAITWKILDIRGIDTNFYTHKILMEDDFKPVVQHQRRVNPKIHEVIKAEVIKLLDAGLIYPISDSPWIGHGKRILLFPRWFFGYIQIPIDPQDQEKTTFTCPYGTFSYRRMPFGLFNAPGTFQRCMVAIFHDMIEKTMEVFMDDFSVFRDSFSSCLSHLDMMLKRCKDTNLVLN